MGLVPDGYDGRFRYVGTVLERAPGGPHLCGAVVALSYPPQCSGPDVVGWTWAGLGAASFNRTTWGEYELVGTWDGRFHLTEPATVAGAETRPTSVHEDDQDLTTPCPGPAGGGRPVDMARTTEGRVEETARLAATLPGFGGFWIDQPVGNRDPARMVLNARFTERLAERESELRRVWGVLSASAGRLAPRPSSTGCSRPCADCRTWS